MVDTKQTKTIGEHSVASELARRGWAPALTRDGVERTDILAVHIASDERRLVEIQVKTATSDRVESLSWPLGAKSHARSLSQHEFFVFVVVLHDVSSPLRHLVVPRTHTAAAAWIEHMDWLTKPGVPAGKRNAPVERSRVKFQTFRDYEDRWEFLLMNQRDVPVLLPAHYRDLALDPRVGLPTDHEWHESLPEW